MDELLAAICDRLPGPVGDPAAKTQALIFDSVYDDYRGVVIYFRLFNGGLSVGEKIRMMRCRTIIRRYGTGQVHPENDRDETAILASGEVGFPRGVDQDAR